MKEGDKRHKENIFPIIIPWIFEDFFKTSTKINRQVDDTIISVHVKLKANLQQIQDCLCEYFMPQELCDNVIKNGYWSVKKWLADTYKKVAEESPIVQQVLDKYGKGLPHPLIQELGKALQQVPFKWGLSTITSVEVTIESTISYSKTIKYN